LSLLTSGSDVLPAMSTNLIGRFIPDDGRAPVRSDGVRVIQVGRGTTIAAQTP
jgi:hypothetical protein